MAAPMKVWFVCYRNTFYQNIRLLHLSNKARSDGRIRVRFAPSPTGFLHLGGLRTALYNYLFAKSKGGTFILRIEDTDQTRIVPDALEKLESMLQWAGITPDEGPSQGGSFGPYVQSKRLDLYRESAESLIKKGSAYHCFCSPKRLDLLRRDAARRGENPGYDGYCRHLEPGEVREKLASKTPYVIRLKLEPLTEPWQDLIKGPILYNVAENEGDPILMKSDGYPTYHLANVVDDHHMEVSHVLRGDEWQMSTPKHVLLYKAFGWKAPQFAHLPLIVNRDGKKLSKRQGDIHVDYFKKQGFLPEALLSYVTVIGGGFDLPTSSLTMTELMQHFQIERVKRNPGRLDPLFLEESNLGHLQRMVATGDRTALVGTLKSLLLEAFADRSDGASLHTELLDDDYLLHVLEWSIREERIRKVSDLLRPDLTFLWETPGSEQVKQLQSLHPDLRHLLNSCLQQLQAKDAFQKEALGVMLRGHAKGSSLKVSIYMQLMRQVLSGLKEGPPVAEMMMVMGRDNTVRRIQHAIKLMQTSS